MTQQSSLITFFIIRVLRPITKRKQMERRLPEISAHPTMVNTEQVSQCSDHMMYIQLSILGGFCFCFCFHLTASYTVAHGAPVMCGSV